MIAIMQAYVDGKKIEFWDSGNMIWKPITNSYWNWSRYDYRIKPEPPKKVHMPYDNVEDFLTSQKENGLFVRKKHGEVLYNIGVSYTANGIVFVLKAFDYDDSRIVTPQGLFDSFVWQTGEICGKEQIV